MHFDLQIYLNSAEQFILLFCNLHVD